jgi:hypothetical protein
MAKVLLSDPQVLKVDRLEHNRPDLIVKLPEGNTAIIQFTVCRDDSAVDEATQKAQRPGTTHGPTNCGPQLPSIGFPDNRDPIVVGTRGVIPKQTVDSLQRLKKWGFDIDLSKLQRAAVIGLIQTIMKTIRSSG